MNWAWESSHFDTDILGFTTAKISHIATSKDKKTIIKNITELKNDLLRNKIEYATYRVSAENYLMIQSLEENGFLLVDGFAALEAKISSIEIKKRSYIKEANMKELPQLVVISKSVFRGVTRYYHDPLISIEKADKVYENWIKNSVRKKVADKVLVWKEEGRVLGFVTLQKAGHIPLLAVSGTARGKGIGQKLMLAAIESFNAWGIEKVVIETQITNIPALRVYQSSGFKFAGSYFTFRFSSL